MGKKEDAEMLQSVEKSAMTLARSAGGNPVITTCVVALFFMGFNMIEAQIETLIWGERFEHWLDPLFGVAFIAYSAYAVCACAVFNSTRA